MKKKIIIIISSIVGLLIALLVGIYIYGSGPVSKKSDPVSFTIKSGESKMRIVSNLKDAKIIKSKLAAYMYMVSHGKFNMQAGTYNFNRNMSLKEVVDSLNIGKTNVLAKTISITFIEGKTILNYADVITENFGYTPDEIKSVLKDEEFLKELIDKYWFIDDSILNKDIYYALEGYLFPDTYEFYENSSIKDILIKMLDTMEQKLEPYKDEIEASKYTPHEILTMASIIEKEGVNKEDREKISQVIYKRLSINMALGMDVTTYYALGKDLSEPDYNIDFNVDNPYNTRNVNLIGLPVGPICNVGLESIKAALHPAKTNYLYFYADIKTGKVYFAENEAEFNKIRREIGG